MPAAGQKPTPKHRTGLAIPAVLLFFCGIPAQAQPSHEHSPSAEGWFRLGKTLAAQGKTQEAYEAYLAAWKLNRRSPEVACNLGDIELELSKTRDAAEHLGFCDRHFPVTGTEKQRSAVRNRFNDARNKVASITIELQPERASISVDGEPAGESPLEMPIFVEPGSHSIKMEHHGYLPAEKQVHLQRGQHITIALSLNPKLQETRLPPSPPPQPPPSFAPFWPILITGALTLSSIGLGAGMLSGANVKQKEANLLWVELARRDGRSACNLNKNADNCNALESFTSQASLFRGFSIGGFAGGGVAAIATGVFVWRALSGPKNPPPQAASLSVELYPGGGNAMVRGVF